MSVRFTVPRGNPAADRAQAEVLGVVLLVGMVSVAALGLMLVASGAVAESEAQAEQERVEQSFVQLGHAMATAAANGDMPESVEFEAGESGAITKTNAGNFTIQGGNVDTGKMSVGAIEYEHDDGSIIAYQAGGVWAERGNKTRMLSAPPMSYDPADETLILPLTDMSEQRDLSSGPIEVSLASTDPMREASVVENDSVTLTIESPYYRGWEKYFKNSAGTGSVRSVDHTNNTIVVKFGFFEIEEALQTGATVGGSDDKYFHDKHGNIGGEHQRGTLMPEMDPIIEEMIADEKGSNDLSSGYELVDNGTYFVDEIDSGTDYDVDLSDGNVTIVVEGDVTLGDGDSITVVDRDAAKNNVLRIYSGGEKFELSGEMCIESGGTCTGDATAIQFYGPSTMAVDLGPGASGTFEGLLYVASSVEREEWWDNSDGACEDYHQVHEQANGANITGSMVAYSICAHSNGNDFDYDEDLADIDFEAYPDDYSLPPQLTYLNIAIHEMDVSNR